MEEKGKVCRRWPLTLLLAAAACRGAPELPAGAAPEGGPRLSRTARQDRFWAAHGIVFESAFEEDWLPFGTQPVLELRIQNHGAAGLTLPLVRRHGFFPFRSEERGQLDLDLIQEGLSIRYGRHGEERRIRVPDLERESIVVQPGTEFLLSVPVPVQSGATDVLELTVQAQLFPLAVEFEGEPERLVAVRFPRSRVRFGPAEVVELAGLGDMTRLAEALAERPEQVPALAEMLADIDRIRVVDFLVQSLPGPTERARLALLAALGRVTGLAPGPGVEVWRGWWESEDGVRWATQQRDLARQQAAEVEFR